MYITRAYNKFEFDNSRGLVTKSSKEEKLNDEIKYIQTLPAELSCLFPRIIESGKKEQTYYMTMERYAYNNLGTILIENEFNSELWEKVCRQLEQTLNRFSSYKKQKNSAYLTQMYIDKTENEYLKLLQNNEYFNNLSKEECVTINGKKYHNFERIWDDLKNEILSVIDKTDDFCVIHGDLCFSNILCGGEKFPDIIKFIDPRGSFGEAGHYGSGLYDLAKLRHSFEGGYEYIINDKFILTQNSDMEFSYNYNNENLRKVYNIFMQSSIFTKESLLESLLIEGLIFISMCARHYDSHEHQTLMYLTGVTLLNRYLEEK
jgi:aminoglycoside phosphotransferase